MHLDLLKSHISIETLNSPELPDWFVITGLNGSGKSQLLQAIDNGCVRATGDGSHLSSKLFDFATMELKVLTAVVDVLDEENTINPCLFHSKCYIHYVVKPINLVKHA